MRRIKKQREKELEENKRDKNDIKFKSVRIKKLADLLEEQMHKNNDENLEEENLGNEEDNLNIAEEMIMNQPGKVILKRKKTKKKFEE